MDRLSENKIILIKRKTRLEELIKKYNTFEQAKFFVERLGNDISDYVNEDQIYRNAISKATEVLTQNSRIQIVDREYISNFIFGDNDIVVAIGQDGLVANTLKYLENQVLIGVNPDASRWDGVLLPFLVTDLKRLMKEVFAGTRQIKEVTMAKAELNDGQIMYAVNDLFIGQRTHVSSRYLIQMKDIYENQSSSGVIISTGLGSTGWLKSVLTGAIQITGEIMKQSIDKNTFHIPEWNSKYLYYSVREPFKSKTSQTDLVFGKVTKECPLKLLSYMPENGVIFSDGIETDYLEFNSGIEATITVADKIGHLVV